MAVLGVQQIGNKIRTRIHLDVIYWNCRETNSQIERRILVCRVYHTRNISVNVLFKYAQKHSVTETAIRYKVSRKTVYKWLSRYDGTASSLEDRSHRPKTSPRSHTEQELRQIRRRLKKYKWSDLLLAYQELVEIDGYNTQLWRI